MSPLPVTICEISGSVFVLGSDGFCVGGSVCGCVCLCVYLLGVEAGSSCLCKHMQFRLN